MPDWLKEWALGELRELSRAKVAAVLIFFFGAATGWWVAKTFYAERIDVLQLQIAALERGIAAFATVRQPSISGPNLLLVVGMVLALLVAAVAIPSARGNKRLIEKLSATDQIQKERIAALSQERDQAVVALQNKKEQYARGVIHRYANVKFDEASGSERPSVTVRHCSYAGDDQIAAKIRHVFADELRWPVDLNGSNNPALERAKEFKVVFDVGFATVFDELIHAFSEGSILGVGVTVGVSHSDRTEAHKHLIVKVLPSAAE